MEICIHPSAVRGFHHYIRVWKPEQDEKLSTKREITNPYDRYAIAVMRGKRVVGHMPAEIARISWYFIRNGRRITCVITSTRRRRSNLERGGMEIPCSYIFTGAVMYRARLERMLKRADREPNRTSES